MLVSAFGFQPALALLLLPGDEGQFDGQEGVGVGGQDAHREALHSAVGGGNVALVNVAPVLRFLPRQGNRVAACDLMLRVQRAVVRFHMHVVRREFAQLHGGANADGLSGGNGGFVVQGLRTDVFDTRLTPFVANARFPVHQLFRRSQIVLRQALEPFRGREIEARGVFRHHAVRVELGTQQAHRVLDAGQPGAGNALAAPVIKQRHDLFFQNVIKRFAPRRDPDNSGSPYSSPCPIDQPTRGL